MSKIIRMGIVGLGRIGRPMATKEINQYPDKFQVVATCDLIPERAAQIAKLYEGCREYTDYAEMLKQDDIDLVYICTRSCDHYQHALMAFEAGKDVLLEKPITVSYEQALDLYRRANKAGMPRLYVHQQRRLEAAFTKVKEAMDSGKLGRIYEVNTEQNSFQHRDDWQTLSEFGGGQLLNWGPHIIDQSLQFLGTKTFDIQSYLTQATAGGDCEDHLRIRFIGDNNRVVNMCISGGMALHTGRYFEVYGDRGAAVYEGGKLKLRYINPEQEIPEVISSPDTPGAAFGKSGTYQSSLVIDWKTEEIEVVEAGPELANYWALLYETLVNGADFPITDEDILAIMRTISTVKAQNKYIMK